MEKTITIKLNNRNNRKKTVSIRSMSETHWDAATKLAVVNGQTVAELVQNLIEKEVNGGKRIR